ncbi:MAG: phospholipase D-like domain-containing protein [Candidatus Bathyarchaeia archaeon]
MSIEKTNDQNGFYFTCYEGDGAVLLAFNLTENRIDKLAGFAVQCKAPHTPTYPTDVYWLKNRLNFEKPLVSTEEFTSEKWTWSKDAPFQSFHWVHFPNAGPGNYTYTAHAAYFQDGNGGLKLSDGLALDVDLNYRKFPDFELGFTRGYISSQAYADKFEKRALMPSKKSMDYPTEKYLEQYVWLGAHARRLLFDLIEESKRDNSAELDVFAFDFNEPDIIRGLCAMGPRVRVFMDDSASHVKPTSLEPKAKEALEKAGAQVKTGSFSRYAHNKVIIQKKNGKPVKALSGSANFSVRGLYVQANSVVLFDKPEIASYYEAAFEQAFTDCAGFRKSEVASKWHDSKVCDNSPMSVSFAPHVKAFPLDKVTEAMDDAKSSLMFAMMEMRGGGPALEFLKNLPDREDLYSMGTIEKKGQLSMFKPGKDGEPAVTSFAFLKEQAPKPFKKEVCGGAGQVIHHKFVVRDFNAASPVVFCGSSNFAAGGEKENGDNLIAIEDQSVAVCYAIEAIRLYDHYRFRSMHEKSGAGNALKLADNDGWTKRYYDPKNMKFRERELLCPIT